MNEVITAKEHPLEKHYKLRRTGNKASFEITLPKTLVIREARRLGVSPREAEEEILVRCTYNSFAGLHVDFYKKGTNHE